MLLSSLTTRLEKMLWVTALTLLMHSCCCLCSPAQKDTGCMKWIINGDDVCCDACSPGHRLVKKCGASRSDLCKPCEDGTFSTKPLADRCATCTQCVGAQVLVKECTATTDTVCGCEDGLVCGNGVCSFCVKKCHKGYEPTVDRSCRPCPEGTFNDKTHQKCKPWNTKCQHVGEHIVSKGDTTTDIKCANSTVSPVQNKPPPATTEPVWPYLFVFTLIGLALIAFSVSSFIVVLKNQKRQKTKKSPAKNTPIIRTPTDDPRPLIAIECSFHEAQQEQGSTESVDSKDSSHQLIK